MCVSANAFGSFRTFPVLVKYLLAGLNSDIMDVNGRFLSPSIIVTITFSILVLLALISSLFKLTGPISLSTLLLIMLSLLAFYLGERGVRTVRIYLSYFLFKMVPLIFSVIILAYYLNSFGALYVPLSLLIVIFSIMISNRLIERPIDMSKTILLLSIITLIALFIQVRGIPILNTELRMIANTSPLRIISLLLFMFPLSILTLEKRNTFPLAIFGAVIFSFIGFRSDVVVILLTYLFSGLLTKEMNRKKLITVLIVLTVLMVMVGYVVVSEHTIQRWHLSPAELVLYRAGFTMNVFQKIADTSFPFGITHGLASFGVPRSRVYVGEHVLGYEQSITSTLFGPLILDFGIFALALIFCTGFALGIIYHLKECSNFHKAMYSISLSYAVIFVEVGLGTISLFFLLLFTFLACYGCREVENLGLQT